MPGYKKHLAIGTIVFMVISAIVLYMEFMPVTSILIAAPLFIFFTLLPDIDSPASKIRRIVEVGILIIAIILLMVFDLKAPATILMVLLVALWFAKHRGVFHNPITGFSLTFPIVLYDTNIGTLCYIGFLTHLIADKLFKN